MQILELRKDLVKKLAKYSLVKKFAKAKQLFEENPQLPGLNVELLEPKHRGVYSFRIDRKYRAHFFVRSDKVEITDITLHYQ